MQMMFCTAAQVVLCSGFQQCWKHASVNSVFAMVRVLFSYFLFPMPIRRLGLHKKMGRDTAGNSVMETRSGWKSAWQWEVMNRFLFCFACKVCTTLHHLLSWCLPNGIFMKEMVKQKDQSGVQQHESLNDMLIVVSYGQMLFAFLSRIAYADK